MSTQTILESLDLYDLLTKARKSARGDNVMPVSYTPCTKPHKDRSIIVGSHSVDNVIIEAVSLGIEAGLSYIQNE